MTKTIFDGYETGTTFNKLFANPLTYWTTIYPSSGQPIKYPDQRAIKYRDRSQQARRPFTFQLIRLRVLFVPIGTLYAAQKGPDKEISVQEDDKGQESVGH